MHSILSVSFSLLYHLLFAFNRLLQFQAQLQMASKPNAVKQETEKLEELRRAVLRAIIVLQVYYFSNPINVKLF